MIVEAECAAAPLRGPAPSGPVVRDMGRARDAYVTMNPEEFQSEDHAESGAADHPIGECAQPASMAHARRVNDNGDRLTDDARAGESGRCIQDGVIRGGRGCGPGGSGSALTRVRSSQ